MLYFYCTLKVAYFRFSMYLFMNYKACRSTPTVTKLCGDAEQNIEGARSEKTGICLGCIKCVYQTTRYKPGANHTTPLHFLSRCRAYQICQQFLVQTRKRENTISQKEAMIEFPYLLFQLSSAPRNQLPLGIPSHVCQLLNP